MGKRVGVMEGLIERDIWSEGGSESERERERERWSDAEQSTQGREIRREKEGGLERDRDVCSKEETPNTSPKGAGGWREGERDGEGEREGEGDREREKEREGGRGRTYRVYICV